MPRAFIAVRIEPPPRLRAALDELASMGPAVKAVAPQNVHMTLHFLGETPQDMLAEVHVAMATATVTVSAFDMPLVGVGAFPSASRPNVVWVGAGAGEAPDATPLPGVVARLGPLLEEIGFTLEDRPWSPHVTVARIKAAPPPALYKFLDKHRGTDFGRQRVASIDLMLSTLGPQGPTYSVANSVELSPA